MISTRTIVFLTTFATLAALHNLAIALSLYWHFWWFDMAMHGFGGVVVALGLYTVRDLNLPLPRWCLALPGCMLTILIVTLIWETFELWAGIPIQNDFAVDAVTDIVMGLSGGLLGYYLGRRLGEL